MNDSLTTPSSADLIRQLEARMCELEMTHTTLARLSGLSGRTLNACLSGHTEISVRLLLRIAAALHLTLQLTSEVPATRASSLPTPETSRDRRRADHASLQATEHRHNN